MGNSVGIDASGPLLHIAVSFGGPYSSETSSEIECAETSEENTPPPKSVKCRNVERTFVDTNGTQVAKDIKASCDCLSPAEIRRCIQFHAERKQAAEKTPTDSTSPVSSHSHKHPVPAESLLIEFLSCVPYPGTVCSFCTWLGGVMNLRIYGFHMRISSLQETLPIALKYLRLAHPESASPEFFEITGAAAATVERIIKDTFSNCTADAAVHRRDRAMSGADIPSTTATTITTTTTTLPVPTEESLQEPAPQSETKEAIQLQFHRETSCLLEAVDFFVCHLPSALFSYKRTSRPLNSSLPNLEVFEEVPLPSGAVSDFYPFLMICIKAGVSFHKVLSPGESKRVGGSSIGGATFMGILRLLCKEIKCPIEAFEMAEKGDNSAVDMLVSDIYGGDYSTVGLKGTTLAATFGKLQPVSDSAGISDQTDIDAAGKRASLDSAEGDVKEEDACASILTMMSYNIAQLAYYLSEIHQCKRILLVSRYLKKETYLAPFQHCVDFWSDGSCRTTFAKFGAFMPAIGAALRIRRRRCSALHLDDWVADDLAPSPHRMLYKP